ncbi:MAG: TonB-dependent receptor plug domain-containing protein, partial [Bryocella sp.]
MNRSLSKMLLVVCSGTVLCAAQQTAAPLASQAIPAVKDTITVVGQANPVTEGESARSTTVQEVQPQRLTVSGIPDMLRADSSVDIEQRGGGATQNDVSIRGSSYEQTLVLLNGLRINDAETSHFNLDLPVPLDALQGLYVLRGAGSTLYGSDAVSGVVDVTTRKPDEKYGLRLRLGAGSFGGNAQAAMLTASQTKSSEVLAGSRDFSDGFIADRDYRSEQLSEETRVKTALGESDVLVAMSDRAFGADQFYGNYNSYERTKGWFASITQRINDKTQAALAYRRHTDVFVLLRDNPSVYENNHIDTSWQGVVRRTDELPRKIAHVDYGLD